MGLLAAVLAGGVRAWLDVEYAAWLPHAPTAYLMWVYPDDEPARGVLFERLHAGELQRSRLDRVVRRALAVRAITVEGASKRPVWPPPMDELRGTGDFSAEASLSVE
jgi:hypothetical protein